MKTLKFEPKLVPLVLSGKKTTTWRVFDDKNLSVGDQLSCLNSETKHEFAKAEITGVREKRLGDVEENDFAEGHERFVSQEAMLDSYRRYYGDSIDLDTVIKIVKFKLT